MPELNTQTDHTRYVFEHVLIDVDQRAVVVDGQEVAMQPRVFDLLAYLIQNRDRAVSKEELQDVIWPGMVVSETVLSQAVMKVRKALGDDGQSQSVIKTLHGHGYRFVAPLDDEDRAVSEPTGNGQQTAPEAPPLAGRKPHRAWYLLLLPLLVLAGYIVSVELPGQARVSPVSPGDQVSIAVLPFTNLNDDRDSEYFSDGLSEEIMNRLARVPSLLVVARTSSFSFKGANEDTKTVARELGVSHLIDGSVRKDGERLRVSAQLIDQNGFQLWSKTYGGVLDDVFSLQDTIANDIVAQVRPSLPVNGQSTTIETVPPTQNLEAYQLVLRGNFHLERRNEGPLKRSIGLFKEAIAADEHYGDAYVGLAKAYALLPFYSYETQEDVFPLAMSALEKGVEMDPSVVEKAAGIRSFMLYYSEWRWIDAEQGFRTALAHTPDNVEVLQWYSLFLGSTGRFQESLNVAQRAQRLDPLSPVVNHRLAIANLWSGNDEQALQYFDRARELGMPVASIPGAYVILLMRSGKIQEAQQVLAGVQRMLGLDAWWLEPLFRAMEDPGQRSAAVEAISRADQAGNVPALFKYGIWTYLQQDEKALDAAFELVEDRPNFNTEFLFSRESAILRENPRFESLVRAIGLPDYWAEYGWPPMCRPAGETIVCR